MRGGIFELIAYGAQDAYLTGHRFCLFKVGQPVSFDEYLAYIEDRLLADIYFAVALEQWKRDYVQTCLLLRKKCQMETGVYFRQITALVFAQVPFRSRPTKLSKVEVMEDLYEKAWVRDNAQTRVLLRKKFEMETGTKWRQFDRLVFAHLEFRPRQLEILGYQGLGYQRLSDYAKVEKEVNDLFVRNAHLIRKIDIVKCLEAEPILESSLFDAFADLVLKYYRSKTGFHIRQMFTRKPGRDANEKIFGRYDVRFALERYRKHTTATQSVGGLFQLVVQPGETLEDKRLRHSEAKKHYEHKQRVANRPNRLRRVGPSQRKQFHRRAMARQAQFKK